MLLSISLFLLAQDKPQDKPAPAPPVAKAKPVPRDLFFELQNASTTLQLLATEAARIESEKTRVQDQYRVLFAEACKAAGIDLVACKAQDLTVAAKTEPAEKK